MLDGHSACGNDVDKQVLMNKTWIQVMFYVLSGTLPFLKCGTFFDLRPLPFRAPEEREHTTTKIRRR